MPPLQSTTANGRAVATPIRFWQGQRDRWADTFRSLQPINARVCAAVHRLPMGAAAAARATRASASARV